MVTGTVIRGPEAGGSGGESVGVLLVGLFVEPVFAFISLMNQFINAVTRLRLDPVIPVDLSEIT